MLGSDDNFGLAPALTLRQAGKVFFPPLNFGEILRFRRVFQPVRALYPLDLKLSVGSVHAFVGPNGAGKTTLLKLASGLLVPTAGDVSVFQMDSRRDARRIKAVVGLCLTEERSFFLRLSGRENLRFFASLFGFSGQQRAERVDELLADMELADVADRLVMAYSQGMKQRLALARALINRPRLLLLDEVSRGLDPRIRAKVIARIRHEVDNGATALFASHNLDEVRDLADRVMVMDAGRIVADGTWDAVQPAVSQVFSNDHKAGPQ